MLSTLRLFIVGVALLPLACGEQRAASPAPAPTPIPIPEPAPAPRPTTATVTGHLRDGETNAPAAGALVVWNAPGGLFRNTTSDGAGYFSFADVPLGVVTISASTTWASGERQVTVAGDSVVDMVLVPRKSTLFGRITDVATGLPLAGATVAVIESPFNREPRNAGRSTTSGSDGAYTLRDIWHGDINLETRRTGHDPVFEFVKVSGETRHDVQMRVARQTLAGTWHGEMTASGFGGGAPVSVGTVTVRHTGATIAADFSGVALTGTLADPAAIGATTHVTGTVTITRSPSGPRIPPPIPCVGTGRFTGLVNYTNLSITAAQVTFAPATGGPSATCGSTERVTLTLAR